MKILVTGSNGLLGQKLTKLLVRKKDVALLCTSKGDNRISNLVGYEYQSMDICNLEAVNQVFSRFNPDFVINTAAMTNVDDCEVYKKECWDINVEGVKNLISACQLYGAHLIHLSTDFVFDGKDGPYNEDDTPNPINYYGMSKYESEKVLIKSDINWSIVRTIILYGVAENMSRSNIVLWAKTALEQKNSLNIVNDQFRSPTLAEDLAMGCWLIAKKGAKGIYHISGKDYMSILELVKRVARFYGDDFETVKSVSSDSLNQKAKRPQKTGFILDKAIKDLNYSPHSFEEGLSILNKQLNSKRVDEKA